MSLELVVSILIFRFLRKSLKTSSPRWEKFLTAGMVVSLALFIASVVVPAGRPFITWLTHAMLLSLVYIIYTQEEFRPVRSLMYAVLPLIGVSLITDLAKALFPAFYEDWRGYFSTALVFAVIWMFAMWFITARQRKALEKEKIKAEEKEQEYRISETLKAKLEVQVSERTAEITRQKEALERTLVELRDAQAQLIQAEKMASLGELTAGIAHEIQNPLNFVNNFSEVNTELIAEMQEELNKGNLEEAKAIVNDIADNEQKINHHGKRADAIVKGMLQHSSHSKGLKEPTDINALADEYLRLAYHGLRAKDKTFNAAMKTEFDDRIGKIPIVPQDMGRVILNLITNAFYAVTEKKKQAGPGFEPVVTVSTRKIRLHSGAPGIELSVRDNGSGIPKHIVDKIFQPFFTTKPAGQGTGLGLSLSYDIVRTHGGEIRAQTTEGEGAAFIIQLPVS